MVVAKKRVGGGRMKKEVFIKCLPAPKKESYEVAPTPKDLSLQDIFSAANQSHIGAWRHKREI